MANPTLHMKYRHMKSILAQTKPNLSRFAGHQDIYDFLRTENLLDNLSYDDALVCGVTTHEMILFFPKEHIRDVLSIKVRDLQLIKHMKKIAVSPSSGGMLAQSTYFNWSDSYPLSEWLNLKVSPTKPDDIETTIVNIDVVIESLREEYQSLSPRTIN